MSLDSLSIALSLTVSLFCFLIFLLYTKKAETSEIQNQIKPVSEEAKGILMQNFLAFGIIPTKSKLISIMSGLASKYNIQLISHLPVHELIDDLIFAVVSNKLLGTEKKEVLTNNLVKLKNEPMNSEDYIYIVSEIEKTDSLKQKFLYTNFITALIGSAITCIALAIPFVQFKYYWSTEVVYLANLALLASLGFCGLTAVLSIWLVCSNIFKGNNKKTPEQRRALMNFSKYSITEENSPKQQISSNQQESNTTQEDQKATTTVNQINLGNSGQQRQHNTAGIPSQIMSATAPAGDFNNNRFKFNTLGNSEFETDNNQFNSQQQ